ncbi:MAG: mandelate racemase/muconate lactonizing protein [Anaerolineae bacterium]|nr:mandelate racemase/muconate lactonizing protein [Anaerolineae bacterium]
MKIADVVLTRVSGTWDGPDFPPGNRQSQAMDVYPELSKDERRTAHVTGPRPLHEIYVEIETDEGITGLFGPIEDPQAYVIYRLLRPFLLGRDPLATETLLDQMLRLNRHGRSGLFMTGISPVDCALWDLKGKAWGQPIYRLLGGPTRSAVPAYASMLGFSIEPDEAARIALEYKAMGFEAQKWFFRYGPGDGEAGKVKNLALARTLREALGEHYTLMFDAFWGWDTTYAVEMVQKLAPLNPWLMEEPVQPERVGGLRRIRQASTVPVATGEHVYTRWQVKELLVNEAVDVLQTDPDWTGGISELVKICALASAFEVPLIAHGHSLLAALHVAGAQSPNTVPMVEYLVRHQPGKQFFHNPTYQPENGKIALPTLPGLGLVLDENKIESRERVTF